MFDGTSPNRIPAPGFGKRVGNRAQFAIEFEIYADRPEFWDSWWGSFWLWVDGEIVGNPSAFEIVNLGIQDLLQASAAVKSAPVRLLAELSTMHKAKALDLVMWSEYGEDENPPTASLGDRETLRLFAVYPGSTPFSDGWQAILVPTQEFDRFIYQHESSPPQEAIWPPGTFDNVLAEVRTSFEQLARALFAESAYIS